MKTKLSPLYALFILFCYPVFAQVMPSVQRASISRVTNGVELRSGQAVLEVQILANQIVRVHVRPDGQSTQRTLVMDPQSALLQQPTVDESEVNGKCTLSTMGLSVSIRETQPYSITFKDSAGHLLLRSEDPFREARDSSVSMLHASGDTLYGISGLSREDTGVGVTRNQGAKVAAGVQGESGAPFLFSVRYGLLVDSDGGEFATAPGRFSFGHSSRPDIEYFVLVGAPLNTMAALSQLVGPPPMPPKWTLGFLNSQWGSTQQEVKQIVATYRQKQIPVDGFILDFDWKAWGEDNYGEWRWNSTSGPGNVAPNKFSDGASGEFAKQLVAQGVKLAGILKPRILTTVADDSGKPTEAAAYATAHHFWYPNEVPIPDYFSHRMARDLDFRNPEVRGWYWEHLRPAFLAGMVGWWNDEADVAGSMLFDDFEFLNMGRMLYEGQRADSNKRVWSINRNFYLGASRYGYAGWSGDIKTGFDSMAYQRRRMLAALDTGEFHWSMDTGGFDGHPSDENYARWMEFAAFVPIMRVHGGLNEHRQPWVYGPIAEAAARNAIDLRYRLLPYIYSYERLNTEGQVGLVRPLFWEFPSNAGAAAQDGEWMFGDALLVAPIVTEGATSQNVYLPPGEWFDYASGKRYAGAQNITIAADAKTWKDIPLFVRSGSILATQPVEQYVGQQPTTEVTLDVFPAQSQAAFMVYDDDGDTYNYERGDYLRQQITAIRGGSETKVTIGGATGNFASPLRTYLLRIHNAAQSVALNGKPLSSTAASPQSLAPDTTWASASDRFGSVVEVRVTAGTKADSVISVR